MTRSSICAALLVVVGVAAAATLLAAQVRTGQPITLKTPKPKILKFKGEVMHATSVQITVRSRECEMVVRTFTYSPKTRDMMLKIIDRGGYQYGDRVVIHHEAGSDVALKIKGKPSKPL